MGSKPWFVIKYWLKWIVFFEMGRLLFLFKNQALLRALGKTEALKTLWHGARMDMSMAAYITIPVILILLSGVYITALRKLVIIQVYTGIVTVLMLLLIMIDLYLFPAWGFRVDASFLKYLSNPKEAYASISHLPVFGIILLYLAVVIACLILFNRDLKEAYGKLWKNLRPIPITIMLLLLAGLAVIPMRGGFQLAPLNQSGVYFSANNFANQASINAPWNFLYSLNHHTDDGKNPYEFMPYKSAESIRDSLFRRTANDSTAKPVVKPNVILIVVESLTSKAIGLNREGKEVMPGFRTLIPQGIYFDHAYASGDRTDKGIVAVLSGYPAQPLTSIVKTPVKASRLPMIPKVLKQQGYHSVFCYGGELEFANMKAYLTGGGFDKYVTIDDFDKASRNSKWGAHDGVVMQRFLQEVNALPSPFFANWLTLSSHEPFEVPVPSIFSGKSDEDLFLNSLHYTDQVLLDFITRAKQQPWWNNTLVVIVADHGHRLPPGPSRADDFRIPILMLGGFLGGKASIVSQVVSQTDLPAIVMQQLGLGSAEFSWSKTPGSPADPHWAYFSFNNGFGFADSSNVLIYDNVGRMPVMQKGPDPARTIRLGQAMEQLSVRDYLDK